MNTLASRNRYVRPRNFALPTMLIVFILLLLAATGTPAGSHFVNDFAPYELDSTDGSRFRDIAISDNGTVTVFWAAGIPHGRASLARLFYRRMSPDGSPLTQAKTVFAGSLSSIVNWIHVGTNARGKWVLANHLVTEESTEVFRDEGLLVWISDSSGNVVEFARRIGSGTQPQDHNHWGCSAVDSAGDFVVCWANNREPDGSDVWCQMFARDGAARADTIRVSSQDNPGKRMRDLRNVKVAMNPRGAFVVVWQAVCDSCGAHDWTPEVFVRLFEAGGVSRSLSICASCEEGVPDEENLGGMYPDVAMQANGDFALVWRQYRVDCNIKILLRLYHADGAPTCPPIVVDSGLCHLDVTPYVASDSSGNLVVAWQDDDGDQRWLTDLKAKRYDPLGRQVGEEFKINDGDKNVLLVTTPVAINNTGLVGFLWSELRKSAEDGKIQQHDVMQLMDLQDIGVYICGDANNDRSIDRDDLVFLLNYLLRAGQSPASLDHCDLNCDGVVDGADVVKLVTCLGNGDCLDTLCPQ